MLYYVDSSISSLGNGYIIMDEKGNIVAHDWEKEVNFTNNQLEYIAVIEAMYLCKYGDTILTDSQLLVGQLNNKYKCKNNYLSILHSEASAIMVCKNITVRWIPRSKNLAGIFIENEIINKKKEKTL